MFTTAPAGRIDRSAARRDEADLIERSLADPRSRVLVIHGDSAPRSGEELGWLSARDAAALANAELRWALLGTDEAGAAVLAASTGQREEPFAPHEGWFSLRASASLDAATAETLVVAVAVSKFLAEGFCPRCGSAAELAQAGWSRRCTGCGAELFPRTDPAVIVAPQSADGERLLLGANAVWKGRMYSCFAGFVEAGESLETTVHRELLEEAGVRLSDVSYVASQPWPYPRSLMLGYLATIVDDAQARPDGTEIVDVRWFTRDEIRAGLAGEADFGLPGEVSIAHRLIRSWAAGDPVVGA